MNLTYVHGVRLLILSVVSLLVYWQALWLPLISDDYLQIALARRYGPPQGWPDLATDALYRCRATSLVLTWALDQLVGLNVAVINAVSVAFHIANSWLVAVMCRRLQLPSAVAMGAAVFFAVYEGHQEAVIWFSAIPELLVFFFGIIAIFCWMNWLEKVEAQLHWFAASLAAFLMALLSKESAVVVPVFMLVAALLGERRRSLVSIVPFFLLCVVYTILIFLGKSDHLHFHDGTFSLKAPFIQTIANSFWRLFWFWGLLAAAFLVLRRRKRGIILIAAVLASAGVAFLPYAFLTYMARVPSRHTYLASAALAVLVGFAWMELRRWSMDSALSRRAVPAALATALILYNCGYVWFKKHPQFVRRAEPTEELSRFARQHRGRIHIKCFPYSKDVATYTLAVAHAVNPDHIHFKPHAEAAEFCYDQHP